MYVDHVLKNKLYLKLVFGCKFCNVSRLFHSSVMVAEHVLIIGNISMNFGFGIRLVTLRQGRENVNSQYVVMQ